MWLAAGVNAAISAESVSESQGVFTRLVTSSVIRKGFVVTHFLAPDRTSAFLNSGPPASGCLRGMPGEGPPSS